MSFLRRFVLHSPRRYAAAVIVAALVALWILYSKGFHLRVNYMDALTTAGAVVFLLGLLQLVAYFGAFDTFGYAFSSFRSKRRYEDLVEYTAAKREKRRVGELSFMPFITVGILVLAAGFLIGL